MSESIRYFALSIALIGLLALSFGARFLIPKLSALYPAAVISLIWSLVLLSPMPIDWTSCLLGTASGIFCELLYLLPLPTGEENAEEEDSEEKTWPSDFTIAMFVILLPVWVWFFIEHPTKHLQSVVLGMLTGFYATVYSINGFLYLRAKRIN